MRVLAGVLQEMVETYLDKASENLRVVELRCFWLLPRVYPTPYLNTPNLNSVEGIA